jgi:hypothetical protein
MQLGGLASTPSVAGRIIAHPPLRQRSFERGLNRAARQDLGVRVRLVCRSRYAFGFLVQSTSSTVRPGAHKPHLPLPLAPLEQRLSRPRSVSVTVPFLVHSHHKVETLVLSGSSVDRGKTAPPRKCLRRFRLRSRTNPLAGVGDASRPRTRRRAAQLEAQSQRISRAKRATIRQGSQALLASCQNKIHRRRRRSLQRGRRRPVALGRLPRPQLANVPNASRYVTPPAGLSSVARAQRRRYAPRPFWILPVNLPHCQHRDRRNPNDQPVASPAPISRPRV